MKSRFYFSLIFFILFLSGCGKDENPDASNETNGKTTSIFNSSLTYGSLTDQDGNTYKTIKIGSQTWMAENLRTTKYRNGDVIETTIPSTKDISTEKNAKYQWTFDFNPGENNVATYGRMYTWSTINDSRNIAPTGWHIPTDAEWETLIVYLGGNVDAGAKLSETGKTHWQDPKMDDPVADWIIWKNSITVATNETGFTALPGGVRDSKGTFSQNDQSGSWWSSSNDESYEAIKWSLGYNIYITHENGILTYDVKGVYAYNDYLEKEFGLNVRCVKD